MTERAPRFPERIGRYDVLLPIASGGMGTVYLARATSIGGFEREVALKLIHSHLRDNASFAGDLVEEAKLTVRIRHPNVVSVIDVGEDPFGIYLVMDYVEGDTLAGLHKRAVASTERELPVRIGLKLLMDALTGLHIAHELKDPAGNPTGLVHRDFSPQNILVGVDGIGRLTDFGIAKAATRISDTSTGIIKGKIAYMAPEQARGAAIDRRTDIWAAGVVAWQIIAGRKLYSGQENEVATLLKIASEPPPRLRDVKPDVPALFDEAVARALTMDPSQRWPSAQAFKQGLLNACRMHGETADTDEVAAFVSRIVDVAIAERRARVEEILRLRAKVERLAGRADASGPTPPVHSEPLSADPATMITSTDWDTRVATVPVQRVTALPQGVEPRTDATSVTEPRLVAAAPKGSRWAPLAYGAAGVVLASILFAAASIVSHHASGSAAEATAPPSAGASPASTPTDTATVALSPAAPAMTVEPPRLTAGASNQAAPPPSPASARSHGARRAAASSSTPSLLPRSPYEMP